jgi:hypothetical protein
MAIRGVEPDVRALTPGDADQVFTALRERVISHGSFGTPPPGFGGLAIVAKQHARFQGEVLSLVGSADVNALGVWDVKGWNETLTENPAKEQLNALIVRCAAQDTMRHSSGRWPQQSGAAGEGAPDGNIGLWRTGRDHAPRADVARRADSGRTAAGRRRRRGPGRR